MGDRPLVPPQQSQPLIAGPFTHMAFNGDPFRNEAGACYYALNMVPIDPENGGSYVRRYGDYGIALADSTTVQWVGVFRRRAGFLNVLIQDGEIFSWTVSGGGSWTKVVTTANLTTASITLSATALIYAVTFNNMLVINDGVNQPFQWNGASGAGGLTLLSNAPTTCYGAPTVYYGKLFFIKDVAASSADRSTIVWSEENDATTGYESGFANAWTLEQSGAGPLYAIHGTNDGLYFFRAGSIGVIRGAVTDDFSTAGTRDDVSGSIGTVSPGGVAFAENALWFADVRGHPYQIPLGGSPVALWQDIADFFRPLDQFAGSDQLFRATELAALQVTRVSYARGVLFSYRKFGNAYAFDHFLFHAGTRRAMGAWSFADNANRVGEMWDDNASRGGVWVVKGGSPAEAYMHPPPDSQPLFNTTADDDADLGRTFIARPLGIQLPSVVWQWHEMVVEFDIGGNPAAGSGTLSPRLGTSERLNTSTSDYVQLTGVTVQTVNTERKTQKAAWGVNRELRWIVPRIDALGTVDHGIGGWGISRIVCRATPLVAHPAKS